LPMPYQLPDLQLESSKAQRHEDAFRKNARMRSCHCGSSSFEFVLRSEQRLSQVLKTDSMSIYLNYLRN